MGYGPDYLDYAKLCTLPCEVNGASGLAFESMKHFRLFDFCQFFLDFFRVRFPPSEPIALPVEAQREGGILAPTLCGCTNRENHFRIIERKNRGKSGESRIFHKFTVKVYCGNMCMSWSLLLSLPSLPPSSLRLSLFCRSRRFIWKPR